MLLLPLCDAGKPIDQNRRLLGEERVALCVHLLVATHHAVRVDHGFGQLCRTRGEEEFGDGVGADCLVC